VLTERTAYNESTSSHLENLLVSALIGVIVGLVATQCFEFYLHYRAWHEARKLEGKWTAHKLKDGRHVDRENVMPGSGTTEIIAKRWYRACCSDSHILEVVGEDTSDGRRHSGPLVLDSICSRLGRRILQYAPPEDEIVEQRVLISHDWKTMYLFPDDTVATLGSGYRNHALCKKEEGKDTRRPSSGDCADGRTPGRSEPVTSQFMSQSNYSTPL